MKLELAQKCLESFIQSESFGYWIGINSLITSQAEKLWIELMVNEDYKVLSNEPPLSESSIIIPLPWFASGIMENDYEEYLQSCRESLKNTLLEYFDEWEVQL